MSTSGESLLLTNNYLPVEENYSQKHNINSSLRAPVDELTGIPLPIAPTVDVHSANPEDINDHHSYFPKSDPILKETLGGRALRVARIQRVGKEQHNFTNRSLHSVYKFGPQIPTDPREQIGSCILLCAGYIPNMVVDTSDGSPSTRPISDWEYNRLSRPASFSVPAPSEVKRFRDNRFPDIPLNLAKISLMEAREQQSRLSYHSLVYGFDPLRNFVIDRVLEQDYSDVRKTIIRKFVEKNDTESGLRLLAIGSLLVSESALVNGRPLESVYREIYSDGRIHNKMPRNPTNIIKNKLGTISYRESILYRLKRKLVDNEEKKVA